ncbi:hypothetical protein C9374_005922 [Naegleria lovaniensis]|uniref:Uncharacterized protein n=1 Tax=Naegleria lovaniensis TaxID=51637 RepID=A0AA88KK06_NAELO|nr:uncharacterized protein C9374_005922 [Naegleria lovaniensis]KAG2382130.1 hypothetical protein C9374_005922 [Naegleria lovaniensis]
MFDTKPADVSASFQQILKEQRDLEFLLSQLKIFDDSEQHQPVEAAHNNQSIVGLNDEKTLKLNIRGMNFVIGEQLWTSMEHEGKSDSMESSSSSDDNNLTSSNCKNNKNLFSLLFDHHNTRLSNKSSLSSEKALPIDVDLNGNILLDRDPIRFQDMVQCMRIAHQGKDSLKKYLSKKSIGELIQLKEECMFFSLTSLVDCINLIIIDFRLNPFDLVVAQQKLSLDQRMQEMLQEIQNHQLETSRKHDSVNDTDENKAMDLASELNLPSQDKSTQLLKEHYSKIAHSQVVFTTHLDSYKFTIEELCDFKDTLFFELALSHLTTASETQHDASQILLDGGKEVSLMLKYMKNAKELSSEDFAWLDSNKSITTLSCQYYNFEEFQSYVNRCSFPNLRNIIGEENWAIKIQEDMLRRAFVSHRNSPQLERASNSLLIPMLSSLSHFKPCKLAPQLSRDSLLFQDVPSNTLHGPLCEPQVVSSIEEFLFNYHHFTEGMLDGLDWSNVIMAGGSVATMITKMPTIRDISLRSIRRTRYELRNDIYSLIDMPEKAASIHYHSNRHKWDNHYSDIDLFIYALDEKAAIGKIRHIFEVVKRNVSGDDVLICRSGHAITFKTSKRDVQIVLRLYKNISEVLVGFDLDSSCFAFDGKEVYTTQRGKRAITQGYNMVDIDRQSYTYEKRLFKYYISRGYKILVPGHNRTFIRREGLMHPIQETITNRIKRIPQPIASNCRGLALLLLNEIRLRHSINTATTMHTERRFNSCIDTRIGIGKEYHKDGWLNESDYSGFVFIDQKQRHPSQQFKYFQTFEKAMNDRQGEHVRLFGTENPKLDFKVVYHLNDLNSNLSNTKIRFEFVTENPGRQDMIGSFHPHARNFYEDAYLPYHELLTKRLIQKNHLPNFIREIPVIWVNNPYTRSYSKWQWFRIENETRHIYWRHFHSRYRRRARRNPYFVRGDYYVTPYRLTFKEIESEYRKVLNNEISGERTEIGVNFIKWRYYGYTRLKREMSFEYIL